MIFNHRQMMSSKIQYKCTNDYATQQSLSHCNCHCRLASVAWQCVLLFVLSPLPCSVPVSRLVLVLTVLVLWLGVLLT